MPRRKPDQPGKTGRPRNMVAALEGELLALALQGEDPKEACRIAGVNYESMKRYATEQGVNGAFSLALARATLAGTPFALASAEHDLAHAKDHLQLSAARDRASHYLRKAKTLPAFSGEDAGAAEKPEGKPLDPLELARGLAYLTRAGPAKAAESQVTAPAPLVPGLAKPPADKRAERKAVPTPAELEQEEERKREEALAEADAEGRRATEAEVRMSISEDQRRSLRVSRYSRRPFTAPKPR